MEIKDDTELCGWPIDAGDCPELKEDGSNFCNGHTARCPIWPRDQTRKGEVYYSHTIIVDDIFWRYN